MSPAGRPKRPGRRVIVRLPEDVLAVVDAEAKREGSDRGTVIAGAVRAEAQTGTLSVAEWEAQQREERSAIVAYLRAEDTDAARRFADMIEEGRHQQGTREV